jgi:broad specificity phosphatase PhoE
MKFAVRALLAVVVGLVVGAAWAQSPAVDDLLGALRAGGHVIVIRHGATHPDQADTDPLNLDNVVKQRQLNDKGRAGAKAVGAVFRTAGEPVTTNDVTEGGQVVSPNENNRRAQALRALAGAVPDPGTNTLIVTHKPNILDAFGKDWFEVKEGEASIFKPDGTGKYALVGRVQVDRWMAK